MVVNVSALGLGIALLVACKSSPQPPGDGGGSEAERACHLVTGSPKLRGVRLQLDTGVIVHVPPTTACIVLDERPPRARVRVTEGSHMGMTGWVAADSVTK